MNDIVVFSLFGNASQLKRICQTLNCHEGSLTIHNFPDSESLVTIHTDVKNKLVIFIAYLDYPDRKIIQLIFAAETAKSLGAKKIYLVAPYLPYMRQDQQFNPGEGITSIYFARLISHYFEYLITFDPHLHRWHALSDIYQLPSKVLHAASAIATWVSLNITKPVLLGPDEESTPLVREIAKQIAAPFYIFKKNRLGDKKVVFNALPDITLYNNDHNFVLIDDIIASAATMIEAVFYLQQRKVNAITCITVHGIFTDNSHQKLLDTGVKNIISCNTIVHPSNAIDITNILVDALVNCLAH